MPNSVIRPSLWFRFWCALASLMWWSTLALGLAFAIAWGALHTFIVPKIGELRPRLEHQVSQAIGVTVTIGAISAKSSGVYSNVSLTDVVLYDAQSRPALTLPRVSAMLSPRSILQLGFDQLVIDAPVLDIRRTSKGRIEIAGIDFSGPKQGGDDSSAADWLFSQDELALTNGVVRWTDELRGLEPLALSGVNLVSRNRGSAHDLRLDATPPPQWGAKFSATGKFRAPLFGGAPSDWRRWQGKAFVEFSRVEIANLREFLPTDVAISQGSGALRAWIDLEQGNLTEATVDLAMVDARAKLGQTALPLALARLQGRLGGKHRSGKGELNLQQVKFDTVDGIQWPAGDFRLSWQSEPTAKASESKPATSSASMAFGGWTLPQSADTEGEFAIDAIELGAVARLAAHLPLPTLTQALVSDMAPQGRLAGVSGKWRGPISAPTSYTVIGNGQAMALQGATPHQATYTTVGLDSLPTSITYTVPGRPGFKGLTIAFEANQAGGKATVNINQGELVLPGVFEEQRVPIDSLSTQAQWRIDPPTAQGAPRVEVTLEKFKVANTVLAADARMKWHTSDPTKSRGKAAFPGVVDMQGSFSRIDAGQIWRFLPMGISKPARDYVRDSLQSGTASDMKFVVKGDLFNMPFDKPEDGTFSIVGPVKGVKFAYVPKGFTPPNGLPWPALTQLSGTLAFKQTSLAMSGVQSKFDGQANLAVRADAKVPNLTNKLTVELIGDVRGPLSEILNVVNTTPLLDITNKSLAKTTGTGSADLRMRLMLPVFGLSNSKVLGSVTLAGNDVSINPETPMMAGARGVVTFSENGFAIPQARATMLGGEVRFEGGMQRVNAAGAAINPASSSPLLAGQDSAVVIRAQGVATSDGLKREPNLGFLARIAANANGQAAYNAMIRIRRGVVETQVSSDLRGMALKLPAPLEKAADSTLPLRYENTLIASSLIDKPLMDQLRVDIGTVAQIHYERDVSGPEPRVLRGSIGVGVSRESMPTLPDSGVQANIDFAKLNLDAWEQALSSASGAALVSPSGGAGLASPAAGAGAAQGYLPNVMAIRAQDLTVGGRQLRNIVLGGTRDGQVWRANLDAGELSGYVEYRQPSGSGAGRVYARLARLSIAAAAAREVEELLDKQPANIPAFDIVVDDFELKGRRLGRLEAEAINRGAGAITRDGGVREWRLTRLSVQMPEATLTAQGNWAAIAASGNVPAASSGGLQVQKSERRRTVMNLKLELRDSGELLKRFGLADVIRGGKGAINGQIAWLGSPLALDFASMTGQLNLNVEAGQFLKADPGLAKLLGVLSLQSLPRRLSLDFRDVFSEGFSFDFIRGDANIDTGVATTNNLQMKGVNAAVLIEGSADIALETQDLLVRVVPEINAGTASLIATAINPAIGLGTFLAQLVLRRPLIMATTQSFEIKGSWIDPKISKTDARLPKVDSSSVGAGDAPPVR